MSNKPNAAPHGGHAKRNPGQLLTWKAFYFVALLTGIFTMVLEVHIFRVTIIRTIIPISIILSVGLTTFILNKTHYKATYGEKGILLPLFQNTVSWGFIACYVFMATNYYLADNESRDFKFAIASKSSMAGPKRRRNEREPLVTIDYFGFKKELVFRYEDNDRVDDADEITITVRKGLLGFDIIDLYDVVSSNKW